MTETSPPSDNIPPTELIGEQAPGAKAALLARAAYALVAVRQLQTDGQVRVRALEKDYPFTFVDDPGNTELNETRAGVALLRMQRTLTHNVSGTTMEPEGETQAADEMNPYLSQLRTDLADIGLYDLATGKPTPIVGELERPIQNIARHLDSDRYGEPMDVAAAGAMSSDPLVSDPWGEMQYPQYGPEFSDALSTEFDKMRELYAEHGNGAVDMASLDSLESRARGNDVELTPGIKDVPFFDELITDQRYVKAVELLSDDLRTLAGVDEPPDYRPSQE